MTAARVQILLDFFAEKTQQIGANIVDIVDIVAVLVKTVNQPGADLFPSGVWKLAFSTAISWSKLRRCWSKTIPFRAYSESLRLAIPIP